MLSYLISLWSHGSRCSSFPFRTLPVKKTYVVQHYKLSQFLRTMLNLCEKERTKINVLLTVFQVEACLFDLRVITHKENTKENQASNILYIVHDYQPSKIDIKVGFEKANEKDKPMKCSAIEG